MHDCSSIEMSLLIGASASPLWEATFIRRVISLPHSKQLLGPRLVCWASCSLDTLTLLPVLREDSTNCTPLTASALPDSELPESTVPAATRKAPVALDDTFLGTLTSLGTLVLRASSRSGVIKGTSFCPDAVARIFSTPDVFVLDSPSRPCIIDTGTPCCPGRVDLEISPCSGVSVGGIPSSSAMVIKIPSCPGTGDARVPSCFCADVGTPLCSVDATAC